VQATFWRTLMSCSMFLHDWAPPRPLAPAFTRSISTEYDHPHSPPILLYFYVPSHYFTRTKDGHLYPLVINFHGGGFSLGSATDDRYWANVVVQSANALLVSVEYRRAPEYPFPTPVDDSVDALLYLAANAEELGINPSQIALSGFSAGANLAFSVPLRLKFHTRRGLMGTEDRNLARWPSTRKLVESVTELKIVHIIAFYPLLDWSLSRDSKRRISRKPDQTLPKFFADLFDYSYLPPPDTMLHTSPFVSPGLAPNHMLTSGLPNDIQILLCEWDMLLKEGEIFAKRLEKLGKKVTSTLIPEVVHGWDKHPDPWRDQKAIDELYAKACTGLRESFGME
jgi:putative ergosteryl-3beta-O-L-aspartate hydrolase